MIIKFIAIYFFHKRKCQIWHRIQSCNQKNLIRYTYKQPHLRKRGTFIKSNVTVFLSEKHIEHRFFFIGGKELKNRKHSFFFRKQAFVLILPLRNHKHSTVFFTHAKYLIESGWYGLIISSWYNYKTFGQAQIIVYFFQTLIQCMQ